MKTSLVVFLVVLVFLKASAADPATNAPSTPTPAGQRLVQDLTKWDANQNGKLDLDELEKPRRDRLREHQARLQAHSQVKLQ